MWIASRQNMWETISKDPGVRAANCKATMTTNNSHRSWVYRKRMLEDASLLKIWPPRKQTSWTEQCYVILNGIRSKIVTNAGSTKNARVFISVCKKYPDSYLCDFDLAQTCSPNPIWKMKFSWRFSPRPYMFPTQALDYRQLSVQFLMFGSSFRSNFGGKNGAHVFFLKCSEGWWFPEFQFFWVDFYINQKNV